MLLLIIPVLVFVIVFACAIWDDEPALGFPVALLSALLSLMLTLVVAMGFQSAPTEVAYSETCEIHALVDNARFSGRVAGNVYLVQSRYDENLKYSYMYMVEGKGYAFNEVNANRCYLNFVDGEPYLVKNTLAFQNETLEWLIGYWGGPEYIFYLPSDAEVIDSFVIDFE